MGSIVSKIYLSLAAIKSLADTFEELSRRADAPAGLPVANPSTPYWTVPLSPIARKGESDTLPDYADVVIIGSGITGASVARALLQAEHATKFNLVMLEARDVCSGATAR